MKQKKQLGLKIKLGLHLVLWKCLTVLPLNRRKVVISDFHGKGFGDSPKYIALALHEKDPSFRVICLCAKGADTSDIPSFVKTAGLHSAASAFHQATAKFWIDNCRKNIAVKRKSQYYIQTWHGFALKKIEKDVPSGTLTDSYIRSAKRDSAMIDLIVSCSAHMTRVYTDSFWYGGEVLTIGSPRNDSLIHGGQSERAAVERRFKLTKGKKIILYAPTFRDDKTTDAYLRDFRFLSDACSRRFGGDFVVFVRLHPHAAKMASFITYGDTVINTSNYPDSQELLCAADVLITDYSSVMFDFALSRKPCFLYASDLEKYTRQREFYFDIKRLPFALSETRDKLTESIVSFDENAYLEKINDFFEKVGMDTNGVASQKVAELIAEKAVKS